MVECAVIISLQFALLQNEDVVLLFFNILQRVSEISTALFTNFLVYSEVLFCMRSADNNL